MSNQELLNAYNIQTSNGSLSSMYTEHDDRHWDRSEYDDWDFNGNNSGGGHADEHSDGYHYDD